MLAVATVPVLGSALAGAPLPVILLGSWGEARAGRCTPSVTFRRDGADYGSEVPLACTYSGMRHLHGSRWYLDLVCPGGRPLHLDINALDDGGLLIAERPLGTAGRFRRCDASDRSAGQSAPDHQTGETN